MKKLIVAAVLAACGVGAVQAQESPWMVRFRAVNLDMSNKDSTGLGLTANNKVIPEIDISYFFNKNVAAELILTVPQKHTVHSSVTGADVGTFNHLPPTLLLQYHFTDFVGFKPYVGAGINYTKISNVQMGTYGLDKDSWGASLQVGVDIPLDKKWSLNFDLKKTYIKTNVYDSGSSAGTLKLDPLMAGVGLGYRF